MRVNHAELAHEWMGVMARELQAQGLRPLSHREVVLVESFADWLQTREGRHP